MPLGPKNFCDFQESCDAKYWPKKLAQKKTQDRIFSSKTIRISQNDMFGNLKTHQNTSKLCLDVILKCFTAILGRHFGVNWSGTALALKRKGTKRNRMELHNGHNNIK